MTPICKTGRRRLVPRFRSARLLRSLPLPAFFLPVLLLLAAEIRAEAVKPVRFGPFIYNNFTAIGSPFGYERTLFNGTHHLFIGWMEPLNLDPSGLFSLTYLQTEGNLTLSPFQTQFGTTFSLKPLRYLEFGLSYNRLLFNNSLVAFEETDPDSIEWDPGAILGSGRGEVGGADVFTYHGSFTLDLGPLALFSLVRRELWDVDVSGKAHVYEYGNDLLIRARDRVNSVLGQASLEVWPSRNISLFFRDQYWQAERTKFEKNLVGVGLSGVRVGSALGRQKQGIDVMVGYWTDHPLLEESDGLERLVLSLDWKWDIRFLTL